MQIRVLWVLKIQSSCASGPALSLLGSPNLFLPASVCSWNLGLFPCGWGRVGKVCLVVGTPNVHSTVGLGQGNSAQLNFFHSSLGILPPLSGNHLSGCGPWTWEENDMGNSFLLVLFNVSFLLILTRWGPEVSYLSSVALAKVNWCVFCCLCQGLYGEEVTGASYAAVILILLPQKKHEKIVLCPLWNLKLYMRN